MKHKLQTLLKHKLQWLLLLVALLGVSQGVWATYTINANTTFYIDATNFQGNYSNGVYIAIVTESTNGGKIGNIRYGNTGGVSGYVPKNDKWDYKSFTSKSGNIYTFKVTSQITGVYGILVSSKDLSDYNDLWEVNVSGTTESSISGKIYTLSSDYTTHGERHTCCSSGTWSDYCATVGGTAKVNGSTTTNISRGASVTLSLTGQTSGSTVVWQKSTDGGSSWSNVGSITDIPTQNTQYRATVTNGCDAYSSVATVKLPTTIYVDVKSAASWTAAYLYYWGGAGDNGWPGTAMTAVPGNDGWYSGEIPADRTNYIINQNKDGDVNQTNDLTTDGKQKCIKVKSSSGKHDVEETTCPTICTTPSASDISITAPTAKTIIYTGTGKAPSTSAQTISATCFKGDTYLWSANHSGYSYTCAFKPSSGTSTNHSIEDSGSKSTTITFYHEGVYTANFAAGCGNTSGGNKNSETFVVRPGYMYIAGTLLDNSWTFSDSRRVAINKSDSTFTYVWDASYTTGQFLASVNNYCLTTASASYTISNYAELTLNNITKDTDGNHNLNPNVGTINLGDKLRLKIEYKGVNSSGIPKYTLTLNKVPVPTTDEPDNITWTQAKLWGTYPKTSEYASISTSESGFYYGTTSSPATKVYNGSQTAGRLAKTIKNLTPGTTYYYKAFVVSGGVEYCGAVESFTTTACSNPTISTQPSDTDREYCINDASPATLTVEATGGVGAYTYQWKQCATSGGTYTNVSAGSGGTTATYTPSTATAGELYYKCVVTNSGICTSNSVTSNASGKYTIDATSVGGSISGGSTSVCPGTTKNLKLGSYTGSIQWHSSSESGFTPSSTTAISGATSATYAAPISTAGTKYYKAVVKNGVCAAATSSQSYLTVKRSAVAGDYTLTNNAQTYDGTARAVTVTPASGAGAATVYYTGTGSTTYAKSTTAPTNAGSYSISIDAANGDDYCAATNLSLGSDTIKKATQETLTISNTATDLVYCNAANVKLTTSGGSGDGAVTYTVTSGSGSVDGDVLSPSAKGSVSVTATKAASQNFNATTSEPKTFNFNKTAPTVYTLSNVGDATTICGDPSSGAGSGTLRLSNSQTGYSYQLYSNGSPVEGSTAKAGTTGSSIDFPVTSSGTYTVYGYYGSNSSNCPTQMDGEITLTISTQPRLVRSAASVTQYMPVTITSVSTDIAEWKIVDGSGNDVSSSTAYLFDQTYDAISFKGASTNGSTAKTYTIQATTAGGCSATTTITVNPDTESCGG